MPAAASRSNPWVVAAALLAALLALSSLLIRPPVVGLADNGDYIRVMGYAGFDHSTEAWNDRYLSFLRTTYRVLPIGWFRSGYLSSETLLALAARLAVRHGDLFDLRALAAIHVGLLLLGIALLLRACRELEPAAQILGALLLVFFFTDVGYAAPFNSFYSQTASLLFLMLTAGVAADAIRRGGLDGPWRTAAYFLCAAAYVTSKPQEAIQGPILAVLGVRLAGGRGRSARLAARRSLSPSGSVSFPSGTAAGHPSRFARPRSTRSCSPRCCPTLRIPPPTPPRSASTRTGCGTPERTRFRPTHRSSIPPSGSGS